MVLALLITGCSKPEEVISRRLTQANQNLETGRVEEAIALLERLNQSYIDQPAVLEALGFAYARAGQHTSAAGSFVRAADIDANSASLRQLAADSYFLANDFERAAQQYRLYVDEFPGDYRARERVGQIEEQNGDLARALDAYLECYRLRPSGEYAWRVGSIFRRLNNAPQTKVWFETTIKHGEDHVEEALLGLLELELSARDLAAAERTLGQLDRIYPGTLERSSLAGARDDVAAWRTQQQGLQAARAAQERTLREFEEERRRREAELATVATPARPNSAEQGTPATSQRLPPNSHPPSIPAVVPSTNETTRGASSATNTATPTRGSQTSASSEPPTMASSEPTTGALASPVAADLATALEFKERGALDQAIATLWNIVANDDRRVDVWLELGHCYRAAKNFGDAESCLLEASRRAPENIEVTIAYLEVVRESQSRDVYFARLESARRKFPGDPDLAYFSARELAGMEGATTRAVSAFEDFLLLAGPDDRRRNEASAYLARVRGY